MGARVQRIQIYNVRGSITVRLTCHLICLDSAVMLMKGCSDCMMWDIRRLLTNQIALSYTLLWNALMTLTWGLICVVPADWSEFDILTARSYSTLILWQCYRLLLGWNRQKQSKSMLGQKSSFPPSIVDDCCFAFETIIFVAGQ